MVCQWFGLKTTGTVSHRFGPQNQWRRFVSGLVSKPLGRFLPVWPQNWWRRFLAVWSQSAVTVFSGLASKPVMTVFLQFGLKTGDNSFSRFGLKTGGRFLG
jgi:hypothetical protein